MMKRIIKSLLFVVVSLFFLYGLMWVWHYGDYPVAVTLEHDDSLPVIEVGGYRFHGESFGKPGAPVVIVIHGGPGWDYRSLLPLRALSDDYFVVFYDQRGAGLSPRVDAEQLSLQSALDDLDAIVEKFRGEGRIALIGHSWGAMLATAYLGAYPAKVSHAVLAEPGFLTTEMFERSGIVMGPKWDVDFLWFATKKWFESRHVLGPDGEEAGDYFLGEVAPMANPGYYCEGTVPPQGTERWRAGAVAMSSVLASSLDEAGRLQLDLTQGLERYTHPVLLLASECNRLIGIEQQQHHLGFFTRAELQVIPNSGHMMIGEQPAAVLALIREYLSLQE